ncbi:LamG domain-containing protein, partial [bacterium]|nr:LamG domain-containing protein [bacterium]
MKRIFHLLASILVLSLWAGCTGTKSVEAQSSGYSLRFRGHGTGDIDRVKIKIDAPAVPADVGGNFTIEFWLKAALSENLSSACTPGSDHWINGNTIIDRDIFGNGDYGDYGISLANGRIAFGVTRGTAKNTICGATNVANGKWHHIAVTRSSATGMIKIFVDGRLDRSGTGPTGNI